MSRIFRLLLSLIVLSGLVACGNKGDLVKPAEPAKAASLGA
ncbi:MAG: lipoprotein [Dokdonella sp.]